MASGWHLTEETRARMSAAHKGKPSNHKGHPLSPEARARISAAKTNPSAETRRRISEANWKGGRAATLRRFHAKRRRLGCVPVNEPFPGCEGHHIDTEHVIYIPKELHRSVYHCLRSGQGMDTINTLAYEWLARAA